MTIIYRILSLFISIIALLLAVSLLFILPLSISVPAMWLPLFILIAIVLYTFFSSRFRVLVLQRQEQVKDSLRDWIRVNGFVTIAFAILNIPTTISILVRPATFEQSMKEMMKQFGEKFEQGFRPEQLGPIAMLMLIYFVSLLVHVLWTFALMKKYHTFFKKD